MTSCDGRGCSCRGQSRHNEITPRYYFIKREIELSLRVNGIASSHSSCINHAVILNCPAWPHGLVHYSGYYGDFVQFSDATRRWKTTSRWFYHANSQMVYCGREMPIGTPTNPCNLSSLGPKTSQKVCSGNRISPLH